jgi:hypothetical protein
MNGLLFAFGIVHGLEKNQHQIEIEKRLVMGSMQMVLGVRLTEWNRRELARVLKT